jgi:hypothetical protein
MPFVSQAQRGWMHANHPEMAARWDKETPRGKKLPKHVKKRKAKRKLKRGVAKRRGMGHTTKRSGGRKVTRRSRR